MGIRKATFSHIIKIVAHGRKIIILLGRIYITSGTIETGRGFHIERTKLLFVLLAGALAVPSTVLNRKRDG